MAVGGAQAELLIDAAASLLEHRIEAGAIAVALEGMQKFEPSRSRPFELAARKAQLRLRLGTEIDAVGIDIPIEDDLAAAGQTPEPCARHR